jgi:hypothetical protein
MQPRPPRVFLAHDLLTGKISLDNYPFNLIYLIGDWSQIARNEYGLLRSQLPTVDGLLTAAELLESRGWQVISSEGHGDMLLLRRVSR